MLLYNFNLKKEVMRIGKHKGKTMYWYRGLYLWATNLY